jgi:homocysteine S-methyltransferase
VVVSFTVETDGRLPSGESLKDAIETVDVDTDVGPSYFMINCAHPDHFNTILDGGDWMQRLKGIVANASKCSHAELDEAKELDDGNPIELAEQLADIRQRFPQIKVLGGCCGTGVAHLEYLAHHLAGFCRYPDETPFLLPTADSSLPTNPAPPE